MTWIIITLWLITAIQLIVCHFSLWWIIALICRILFTFRIVGATFKVRNLAIGEAVAFGAMVIFNMMFAGETFPWLRLLLFALLSLISVALMFIDDIFYVYVIEDEE